MGAHRYERQIRTRAGEVAAFLAMSCLAWGLPTSAQASSSPSEVQTEPAEVIPGGAKLKGELNPGGLPMTYDFEYIGDNAAECLGVERLLAPDGPHGADQRRIPATGSASRSDRPENGRNLSLPAVCKQRRWH